MANLDIHHSGPLVVVRTKGDTLNRQQNGLLVSPPRLFVTRYEPKTCTWSTTLIDWDTAETLAPEHMAAIAISLQAARDADPR